MKQFCKLEGPSGNSAAFQRGWDLAFGTPAQKARAMAEIEGERAAGASDARPYFHGDLPEYIEP